jgi:hypothetical protein
MTPTQSDPMGVSNGFRNQRRHFPRRDLLKRIEKRVTQLRSGTGERIHQKKQQQKGRE